MIVVREGCPLFHRTSLYSGTHVDECAAAFWTNWALKLSSDLSLTQLTKYLSASANATLFVPQRSFCSSLVHRVDYSTSSCEQVLDSYLFTKHFAMFLIVAPWESHWYVESVTEHGSWNCHQATGTSLCKHFLEIKMRVSPRSWCKRDSYSKNVTLCLVTYSVKTEQRNWTSWFELISLCPLHCSGSYLQYYHTQPTSVAAYAALLRVALQ